MATSPRISFGTTSIMCYTSRTQAALQRHHQAWQAGFHISWLSWETLAANRSRWCQACSHGGAFGGSALPNFFCAPL